MNEIQKQKSCERRDERELQMERVELQTKIFIGGDGANGNEGIY